MTRKQRKHGGDVAVGAIAVIAILIYSGCSTDKKPAAKRPVPAVTPEPTPDKAAVKACAQSTAANMLRVAGKDSRAVVFEKAAVATALTSRTPKLLAEVTEAESGREDAVSFWCSLYLPEVNDDNLDRHLPSFRKERLRTKKLIDGFSGGSGGGSWGRPGKRRG